MMMRAVPLIMCALVSGCGLRTIDPCAGVSSACVALQIEGSSAVDKVDRLAVHLDVDGAVGDKQAMPAAARATSLPLATAVIFDQLTGKAHVQIDVTGMLAGAAVGHGAVTTDLEPRQHVTLHVVLTALTPGDNADLAGAPADLTTSDAGPPTDLAGAGDGGVSSEQCGNAIDDDGNGQIDCLDNACNGWSGGARDPSCPRVQHVQNGSVSPGAMVALTRVFVTLAQMTSNGSFRLYVQEPEGQTALGLTYPQYSGVQVFINSTAVPTFPVLADMVVGDCVSVTGTVTEFNQATEIVSLSALEKIQTSVCGISPAPYPVAATMFAQIATDSDPAMGGDQPGSLAEAFEGVLVEVDDVTALTANDSQGVFRISATGGTGSMLVSNFLYQPANTPIMATVGQHFSVLRGLYDQSSSAGTYRLEPRSSADVVTP
jgi:hypothetical protein